MAEELLERAKMRGHLPTIRLCRDARTKAQTAAEMYQRAMEKPMGSMIGDHLRFDGLEFLAECDWAFFDIEHTFKQ